MTVDLVEKQSPLSVYAEDVAARRRQITHDVGAYRLRLHPSYKLWTVERIDGAAVPQPLMGLWVDIADFEAVLAHFEKENARG